MKAIRKFRSKLTINHEVHNCSLLAVIVITLVIALLTCSGCTTTKFAPEDGYQFQQLFESDDLNNYNQVEVGIGTLDFIDTSLVYTDTKIEDIPASDLEQGIIDASHKVGPGSSKINLIGFAQLDAIDAKTNTITVSEFGSTIENAFEQNSLTLEVGQDWLSCGEAILSDVKVGDTIAINIGIPQENDPLFGYMWATDNDGQVKLIDHPETYTSPEES